MNVCAQGCFSTSVKLYRPHIHCVIAQAFYFILESVLCALHVLQMIPRTANRDWKWTHRTVLWLLQTWLGVDLTPESSEGHSVTMRSSKLSRRPKNLGSIGTHKNRLRKGAWSRRLPHLSAFNVHRAPMFSLYSRAADVAEDRGNAIPVLRGTFSYLGMVNALLSWCVLIAAFCTYGS